MVDAEVCEVAKAARAILLKAMGEGRDKQCDPTTPTTVDTTCMYALMKLMRLHESMRVRVYDVFLSDCSECRESEGEVIGSPDKCSQRTDYFAQ